MLNEGLLSLCTDTPGFHCWRRSLTDISLLYAGGCLEGGWGSWEGWEDQVTENYFYLTIPSSQQSQCSIAGEDAEGLLVQRPHFMCEESETQT